MSFKKLHMSQIFSNLEFQTFKCYILVMCNLYTKFLNFLEICKQFSYELVNEKGNIVRRGCFWVAILWQLANGAVSRQESD